MTRTRTLIAAAVVVALGLPWGAVFAQTPAASTPAASAAAPSRPEIRQPASDDIRSPMQEQAMVPNMAPITTVCGRHNAVTMKDEFGHQYNCRGDRVR